MSHSAAFFAAASLILCWTVPAFADPPDENVRSVGLGVADKELVISARTISWQPLPHVNGILIRIGESHYLRHNAEGEISLTKDVTDGCFWTMKIDHVQQHGNDVVERYSIAPRDPKLAGWRTVFRRGVLCLWPNAESAIHFESRYSVTTPRFDLSDERDDQ